jgi:RNA polymerase sigma factor (sigma-70 family)
MPRLTEKQQELVTEHIPLVKYLTDRFGRAYVHLQDEFESAGYLGLIHAALRFDHRDKFVKYASRFVRGNMLDVIRNYNKAIPLQTLESFQEFEFEDENLHMLDDLDAVEVRLRNLPKKFREVCKCIYLHGMRYNEIAVGLKISEPHVSATHLKALRMLNPYYDGTI